MENNRVLKLICGLLESADYQKVLDELKLSPAAAMRLLRGSQGRSQLKARRQLAKLQSRMLASRFGPYAVQVLTSLLNDKNKPELQMKGALSVLDVSGLSGRKAKSEPKLARQRPVSPMKSAELRELVNKAGEWLRKDRSAKAFEKERKAAEKERTNRLPSP